MIRFQLGFSLSENNESFHAEEGLDDEFRIKRIEIALLRIHRYAKKPVVSPMDRPVVVDILPDDRTDEDIGQDIVYSPLSGEIMMYGFMEEKLDKCDRVAEEKTPSENADNITCQRRPGRSG